jgi:hypothetical protein
MFTQVLKYISVVCCRWYLYNSTCCIGLEDKDSNSTWCCSRPQGRCVCVCVHAHYKHVWNPCSFFASIFLAACLGVEGVKFVSPPQKRHFFFVEKSIWHWGGRPCFLMFAFALMCLCDASFCMNQIHLLCTGMWSQTTYYWMSVTMLRCVCMSCFSIKFPYHPKLNTEDYNICIQTVNHPQNSVFCTHKKTTKSKQIYELSLLHVLPTCRWQILVYQSYIQIQEAVMWQQGWWAHLAT